MGGWERGRKEDEGGREEVAGREEGRRFLTRKDILRQAKQECRHVHVYMYRSLVQYIPGCISGHLEKPPTNFPCVEST